MYLYFDKRILNSTNRIKRTNHTKSKKSEASSGDTAPQITTAPVLLFEYKHTVLALRVLLAVTWLTVYRQLQIPAQW